MSSELRSLQRRMVGVVKDFNKTERKRILRKGARQVVLEARRTSAFKDRTGVLRKSLNRITGLRKSRDEFVGPRQGKNERYDGFYAQMLFGAAAEFNQRVLVPAALRAAPKALPAMNKESQKAIQRIAAKKGLN